MENKLKKRKLRLDEDLITHPTNSKTKKLSLKTHVKGNDHAKKYRKGTPYKLPQVKPIDKFSLMSETNSSNQKSAETSKKIPKNDVSEDQIIVESSDDDAYCINWLDENRKITPSTSEVSLRRLNSSSSCSNGYDVDYFSDGSSKFVNFLNSESNEFKNTNYDSDDSDISIAQNDASKLHDVDHNSNKYVCNIFENNYYSDSNISDGSLESFRKNTSYNPQDEASNLEHDNNNDSVVNNDVCNDHKFFDIENGKIIVLKANSPLYVHGAFCLSVLYGAVKVLGYKIDVSHKEIEIYSPRSTSHLFLLSESRSDDYDTQSTELLHDLQNHGLQILEATNVIKSNDTILLCKRLFNNKISYLKSHIAQHIFPQSDLRNLDCVFNSNLNGNLLKIDGKWDQLAELVDDKSKVMLCGGKGVGKSTLLRFLINKLLMKFTEVLIIDLDPGQSEFTVSGCVSSTVVSNPIFGPSYTHLMKPERCIFIGSIDVSYDTNSYINGVKELLNISSDIKDMPILINCMGFTKGIGLNLTADIVSLISPTHLFEVQSRKSHKNYAVQLTMNAVKEMDGLYRSNIDQPLNYQFSSVASMADDNEHFKATAHLTREMCIISYFSQMLSADRSLTSTQVTIYAIDLNGIKIICNDNSCSTSVINGSVVALCEASNTKGVYKCHGWGIVRGVDIIVRRLYLITPISSEELERVYYLMASPVKLPASLYMTENEKLGHVPYVSVSESTQYHQIPKRSYISKNVYQSVRN